MPKDSKSTTAQRDELPIDELRVRYTGKRGPEGLFTMFDQEDNPVSFDPDQEKIIKVSDRQRAYINAGKVKGIEVVK